KGDVFWVRETWKKSPQKCTWQEYSYKANYPNVLSELGSWRPSIHMPKEACRIFLEVTNVRVERLRDISESDAIAEGIEVINNEKFGRVFKHYFMGNQEHYFKVPELSFQSLWQSINGKNSWEANPWVWVYDFKRVEKPE